jgi:hypothetical protein
MSVETLSNSFEVKDPDGIGSRVIGASALEGTFGESFFTPEPQRDGSTTDLLLIATDTNGGWTGKDFSDQELGDSQDKYHLAA